MNAIDRIEAMTSEDFAAWHKQRHEGRQQDRERELGRIDEAIAALRHYRTAIQFQRGPLDCEIVEAADLCEKLCDLTEVDGLFERACDIREALNPDEADELGRDDPWRDSLLSRALPELTENCDDDDDGGAT